MIITPNRNKTVIDHSCYRIMVYLHYMRCTTKQIIKFLNDKYTGTANMYTSAASIHINMINAPDTQRYDARKHDWYVLYRNGQFYVYNGPQFKLNCKFQ